MLQKTNHPLQKSLLDLLRCFVTLVIFAPFYIAIIYSVKSKPELVTNRLAWPKTIHWENFTTAIRVSNFGLALKNSAVLASEVYERIYGLTGLESKTMPKPETPLHKGMIGYHMKTGEHNLDEYNWNLILDFADMHGMRG